MCMQAQTYSRYDVNHDGEVNVFDITCLANYILGQVNFPVESVTLSDETVELKVGETKTIKATVLPEDADQKELVWKSTKPSIATVEDGVITAVATGSAVVMATTTDGSDIDAYCIVNVKEAPSAGSHEYVDLGLSVKWATCNIGAEKPEDYGLYFAWGETVGYGQDTSDGHKFDWPYYKWCSNSSWTGMTKYTYPDGQTDGIWYSNGNFVGDYKTTLALEDDAAHVNWGGSWRMPTRAEQDELRKNCTWTWTTLNGVYGRKVTGPNGNSIFLPAAGYRVRDDLLFVGSFGFYWSSSLNESYSRGACDLSFDSNDVDWSTFFRCSGQSVRAVCP